MRYAFIRDHAQDHEFDELCEALQVRPGGYYSWRARPLSVRKREDAKLKGRVLELHEQARGRYGHRPVYHHLLEEGLPCGRDRTLRLMNELGLRGDQATRYKPVATDSKHLFGYSPNLLKEFGRPTKPNQIWAADTTYMLTAAGWSYLATVMDLCRRRVIGWSVGSQNDTHLVCTAFENAVADRGNLPGGIIHHSGRGSTYASHRYINAEKTNAFRKKHEEEFGAKFIQGFLGSLPELPSDYFDMVCSVSVIEHIPRRSLSDVFNEIHRILKPGGLHVGSYDVHVGQWVKPVLKAQVKSGLEMVDPHSAPLFGWPVATTCFEDGRHILKYYLHNVPEEEKGDRARSNFGTILNCSRKPLPGEPNRSDGPGFLLREILWEARWRLFHKKRPRRPQSLSV